MASEWPPAGWQPVRPPLRIGDAERDAAIRQLREHHAAGRLDLPEFEQRMGAACAAVTAADLDALFWDLPSLAPVPRSRPATRQQHRRRHRQRRVALALAGLAVAVGGFLGTVLTDWSVLDDLDTVSGPLESGTASPPPPSMAAEPIEVDEQER